MSTVKDIDLLIKVATKFKALRNATGLTQADVYLDTGIHIGRIESFQNDISISTIQKLTIYYNVTLGDFFKDL